MLKRSGSPYTGKVAKQTMPSHQKELVPQLAWVEVAQITKKKRTRGQALGRKPASVSPEVTVRQTLFERAVCDLGHQEKLVDDLTFDTRVGFYELCGVIGSGNFSQVKLGIHHLTKGETRFLRRICSVAAFEIHSKQCVSVRL